MDLRGYGDSGGERWSWGAGRQWLMATLTLTAVEVPLFGHVFLAGGLFRLVTKRLSNSVG